MVEGPYVHITHWCLGDCQHSAQCNYCSEVFLSLFFVDWCMGGGSIHKKAPFDACMHAVFHMKWDWFGYSSLLKVASNSSNRNKRKNTINVNISIVNNPLSVHIHTLGITHPPCGLPFHVNLLLYFSVRLFIYSVQIELENGICGGCRCCSQVSELNDVVT